jgi:hypothetical protein
MPEVGILVVLVGGGRERGGGEGCTRLNACFSLSLLFPLSNRISLRRINARLPKYIYILKKKKMGLVSGLMSCH